MDPQWSRWLLKRTNTRSDLRLGTPHLMLGESERKLLTRYAMASDHLVPGPSGGRASMDVSASPSVSAGAERMAYTAPSSPTLPTDPTPPLPTSRSVPTGLRAFEELPPRAAAALPTPTLPSAGVSEAGAISAVTPTVSASGSTTTNGQELPPPPVTSHFADPDPVSVSLSIPATPTCTAPNSPTLPISVEAQAAQAGAGTRAGSLRMRGRGLRIGTATPGGSPTIVTFAEAGARSAASTPTSPIPRLVVPATAWVPPTPLGPEAPKAQLLVPPPSMARRRAHPPAPLPLGTISLGAPVASWLPTKDHDAGQPPPWSPSESAMSPVSTESHASASAFRPSHSPSRGPDMDTMGVGEDLPPPIRESRRVRVLNKLNLGLAPSPTPPGTPTPDQTFQVFSPTLPRQPVPSAKTPPALVTLERAAACALFFEQYYHALAHRCSRAAPPIGGGRQHRGRASAKTFEFGRVIGQGAFGVVRIAREKENGRMVAIKQLRKVDLLRMGQEGHIRAEKDLLSAASAQALVGPTWIPKLHYSFQDEDHLYFALEFMGGGDLLTMLVSRGSLPEATVRFYAAEMVLALHQTHMLGYIHRDVKPDNFLFTSEGHIRVADFGLATDLHWSHDSAYYEHQRRAVLKRYGVPLDRPAFGNRRRNVEGMQGGWGDKGSSKSVLTWRNRHRRRQAYTICGTNSYMAPEVIRGTGYGFGVDWWGLGIIVYEAIYGTIPFVGNSREHVRKKILNWRTQLQFPPRGISAQALDFMKRLLCEPEDRLGSIGRRGSVAGIPKSPLSPLSSTPSLLSLVTGPTSPTPGSEFALGTDGVEQLMAHPWFADIDWAHLHEMVPPFRPCLRSVDDTRHFDEDIPDEPLAPGNSTLYLRDPILGDKVYGKEALAIRKNLAFKGWTFSAKPDPAYPPSTSMSMSTSTSSFSSLGDVSATKLLSQVSLETVSIAPSPHRSRRDISSTLHAPAHEPTMQTLVTSTTEGTGSTRGQGNWPKGYGDTDSEFSDESDSLDAVSGVSRLGMGWNGTDVDDEEGQTANDDNVSDGMVDDVDGDITSAEPDTEIETPEIDESADPVADVIDGYFNPEHQYGWSGHPRRLYPRDYKVPSPPLRPEPADDDGRWWNYNHQEQELDFGEMLALDRENVENLERPVCVPAASPPTGSKGRKARVLNKLSTKGRNKSERPKSVLTANLFSLRP